MPNAVAILLFQNYKIILCNGYHIDPVTRLNDIKVIHFKSRR